MELLFDPATSTALTAAQRERLAATLTDKLVGGRISIVASEQRSQLRNRATARERLSELLTAALAPLPAARRATKPTKGSQRRRLESKKRRSDIKSGRGRMTGE